MKTLYFYNFLLGLTSAFVLMVGSYFIVFLGRALEIVYKFLAKFFPAGPNQFLDFVPLLILSMPLFMAFALSLFMQKKLEVVGNKFSFLFFSLGVAFVWLYWTSLSLSSSQDIL